MGDCPQVSTDVSRVVSFFLIFWAFCWNACFMKCAQNQFAAEHLRGNGQFVWAKESRKRTRPHFLPNLSCTRYPLSMVHSSLENDHVGFKEIPPLLKNLAEIDAIGRESGSLCSSWITNELLPKKREDGEGGIKASFILLVLLSWISSHVFLHGSRHDHGTSRFL